MQSRTIKRCILVPSATALIAAAGLATMFTTTEQVTASSHSDAPLVKMDRLANLTDVYAFISDRYGDNDEEVLTVIVNVAPFSEPGDGPHYEKFDSAALYTIHITDPVTGETLIEYDFEFSEANAELKNPNTILSYGLGTEAGPIMTIDDARQNYTQTFNVTRTVAGVPQTLTPNWLPVAPPNVGSNVTPLYNDADGRAMTGATTEAELDSYTQQAIYTGANGEAIFAGPRDDSFFADVPGVFDLLNVRILDNNGSLSDGLGQDGNGVDGFKGFNVLTFAIQIPLDLLPASTYNDAFFGEQTGVGVYASVSRRQQTVRNAGNDFVESGPWVQVSRLGNPLFNEVLVALADKDNYNASSPVDDAQYASYASNPEVAALINFVYSTSFVTTGRADLEAVFIPDVLRVATTTGPVPLAGDPSFSRFGFVGGDTTGGVSSGWPNGRRLGDDVVDIALTAVASGPSYDTITVVGDNVAQNDVAYNAVFPYAATPHAGTFNRKDSGQTDFEVADVNGDGVLDWYDVQAFLNAFSAASQP